MLKQATCPNPGQRLPGLDKHVLRAEGDKGTYYPRIVEI